MNREYYTIEQACTALHCSLRLARERLAHVPADLVRQVPNGGRGRPDKLYHVSCLPELLSHYRENLKHVGDPSSKSSKSSRSSILGSHLIIARLRARAVREYQARRDAGIPESTAADDTCSDWRTRPRSESFEIAERIGSHTRTRSDTITVGGFGPSTLRLWAALLKKESGRMESLAPNFTAAGRQAKDIDPALLDMVRAAAVSTARADVAKAVSFAREFYSGDLPDISISTWRRRIISLDPQKYTSELGKRGVAAFRQNCTPDISRDWSTLRYNQLWQLDDVTLDFYGHSTDVRKIIRPYVYAIIRVATREWIAAVTCESTITQTQVRSLLGFAMASQRGGIPEEITFEQGAIACEPYLESLLNDLGIKVHKTGMDAGRSEPGAFADRAIGRGRGKPVNEAANRGLHNELWRMPAGTGPDERRTAKGNLETLKDLAVKAAASGDFLLLPTAPQWQKDVFDALERHNNAEHSGLPRIVDAATGKARHMTPCECAIHRKTESIKVMPESWLPAFYTKGYKIPVTRNGIRLFDVLFGSFDQDLQALAGTAVTVYGAREMPTLVYVEELGRCVARFDAPAYEDADAQQDLQSRKGSIAKSKQSEFASLMDRARTSGEAFVQQVRLTPNPLATRPSEIVQNDKLAERARNITQGIARHHQAAADLDSRFRTDSFADRSSAVASREGGAPGRRRGLLSRSSELHAQLNVLKGRTPEGNDQFSGLSSGECERQQVLAPVAGDDFGRSSLVSVSSSLSDDNNKTQEHAHDDDHSAGD